MLKCAAKLNSDLYGVDRLKNLSNFSSQCSTIRPVFFLRSVCSLQEYTDGMEFLSSFELQCATIQSVKRLRAHPSYSKFINKWSLPVYFQIRYIYYYF